MKLSIISPVYAVKDYIADCVKSLACQQFDDYEVLFVDDHGPDDSIALAMKTAEQLGVASHFRTLETPVNGGPGAARNVGMEHASGEYIAFVDSDDWIAPTMFLQLVQAATAAGGVDLCCCGAQCVDDSGKVLRYLSNPLVGDGEFTVEKKRFFLTHFKTYIWTYIYRRQFLEDSHITFPHLRSSEDSNFLVKALLAAQTIAQVNEPLYGYRVRPASLTTQRNETRYRIKLQAFEQLFEEVGQEAIAKALEPELSFLYLKKAYLVGCLNYLNDARRPQVQILRDIAAQMERWVPEWRHNCYYQKNLSLRMVGTLLHDYPQWAIRILPWLLRHISVAL